jgi:uncharacterized protein YutE (UPF0331/DUF86 family)|tara:strand:- start:187 stop:363 length:177 start_codon:yes stop_codon:yes gene_type:complete
MGSFLTERIKSLVSKKLGATLLAEGALTGTELSGYPLMLYIIVQAAVDIAKHWIDSQE